MTKRLRALLTLAIGSAALALAGPASAQTSPPPITEFLNACPTYGDVRICSGEVPSFDGTPLDVDLTMPVGHDPATRAPLMIMLHGFGSDKHHWESNTDEGDGRDLYHWNNRWFARHGYYVLTYTARGFRTDPAEGNRPPTPSGTSASLPNGTIRLKSRDVEIRDTQWLAALVARSYDVDPSQIGVTGNSYGAGESWMLASRPEWTFPHEQSPELPVLQLQVAVPKYGWTDLAYSLAPNGHPGPTEPSIYESSQGAASSQTGDGNPVGVPKQSYINGFFLLGKADGIFENGTSTTQTEEGPISIDAWKNRIDAGDPYDVAGAEDAVVRQVRRGLTELRSSYYQDAEWAAQAAGPRRVAIFAIQGWTDDLFSAVEATRQFKYLKRLNPRWPIALELADVGHPRAQNRPEQWRRLNQRAWEWTQHQIRGSHDHETTVASEPMICADDGEPDQNDPSAMRITAQTPESLASGTLSVQYARGDAQTHASGSGDPDNVETDPALGYAFDQALGTVDCRVTRAPEFPGRYTAYSAPLPDASTYAGLGFARMNYVLAGGNTATVNARVWDVAPSGATVLITRGTYRLSVLAYDEPAGELTLPLFGNHYQFRPGHRIRLDVQMVDEPTFRRSNVASAFTFDPPRLVLPIREAADRVVPGS